jgi:hypothetical protein
MITDEAAHTWAVAKHGARLNHPSIMDGTGNGELLRGEVLRI